ncbi:MAG: hypothetical protein DME21_14535 [Verrucomicrobia bacterium]|nr:MAG: hypothetical protein DME21_14535 [Verrucomicrobiota bacterium]
MTLMKNNAFTAVLAGVLVVAAFAAALLVARVFFATRQLRDLQPMNFKTNSAAPASPKPGGR